jgi:diguanylate cyclase (GGDEF)-like protein
VIGVVFFVMHGLLLAVSADVFPRVILLSATMLIVLALSFRAVWNGTASRRSFSAWLVLGAAAMLIANNTVRMVAALLGLLAVRPFSNSVAAVIIIYLVPLAGILLYTSGLVLLFFERIVREKHHLATHDELTGLLNRRAIAAAGEREVTVALRNRQALTVSIVDIDFFKRINDNMGHEAGDVALAEIARLLKGCCRSSDLVGRYGGEEFCIVFPGADSAKAAMLGERLVAAARTYRFRDRYPVTVSAGLATLSADDIDRSWSHLINRADAELYRAKGRGRDGFCLSSHGTAAATDTSLVEPAGASAQQA